MCHDYTACAANSVCVLIGHHFDNCYLNYERVFSLMAIHLLLIVVGYQNVANKNYFVLFLQNVIAVFVFSDSRCKNACKMLADLCPYFHQSPTRPNFGRSRVKVCPILCRLRTKLCPNFGCSRARLCPISFAPCPFPNLAGTLHSLRQL